MALIYHLAAAIFLALLLLRLADRYHFNRVTRAQLVRKLEAGKSWASVVQWYSRYAGCGWNASDNYISRQMDGSRRYLFLNRYGNWIGRG